MDAVTPPDFTLQLPRDAYYQLIRTLCAALPPVSNSPEDLIRRDNAAIAQVAALHPANADEANLAAQYVAASARAMDCMRLAQEYVQKDDAFVLQWNAQAANMMRQARAARSLLLRVQAARQKLEADSSAADRAAWVEHCAIGLMAEALGRAPTAAMMEPLPPEPEPPVAEPQPDAITEAESYAIIYPQRAALIRRLGRVPDNPSFGPPDDYLVRALVTGRTPILLALDQDEPKAVPP